MMWNDPIDWLASPLTKGRGGGSHLLLLMSCGMGPEWRSAQTHGPACNAFCIIVEASLLPVCGPPRFWLVSGGRPRRRAFNGRCSALSRRVFDGCCICLCSCICCLHLVCLQREKLKFSAWRMSQGFWVKRDPLCKNSHFVHPVGCLVRVGDTDLKF